MSELNTLVLVADANGIRCLAAVVGLCLIPSWPYVNTASTA